MGEAAVSQTWSAGITAADFARRPNEGCGVVGVYNHPEAAKLTALALFALQHRGQESAGIASFDGVHLHLHKGPGLVSEVCTTDQIARLAGRVAIGHVRYSTAGGTLACNAQPLRANYRGGHIAVAHNGNLTNAEELAHSLEANGAIFQSTTDSELLIHLIAQNRDNDFRDALRTTMKRLHGAFSVVMLKDDELIAVKDSFGFRPLCLGKIDEGWVVASETCALDILGATFLRELQPGEAVHFRNGDIEKFQVLTPSPQPAFCIFELIYYSRPDSLAANRSIYQVRERLGAELAREHPVEADVVVPVPDSSNPAAFGYAREIGLPMQMGLIRSHYVGRTFIQPGQTMRDAKVKMKFNPVLDVLAGRRVVMVDDSIVRGTTARKIVRLVRDAGAREVHFRVTAPPWRHPCFYGIDTPTEEHLIANTMSIEEMAAHLSVDSLAFISQEALMRSVPPTLSYCTTCFAGRYPDGRPRLAPGKIHRTGVR
ncbi:MAG: amidophosphoribosyltransferase [Candidatus Sumerlaeia bacterium]|nr:amidophosphoribosyltransferase [Candidatus Sumerlaeia bacterium]